MAVELRGYLSPTLVLLAMNWEQGKDRKDFLGFAIKRVPGFRSPDGKSQKPFSWLPNRVTFDGPVPDGKPDVDSNLAPIQKFMWWDARIDEPDRGATFIYTAYPVVGTKDSSKPLDDEAGVFTATLPSHTTNGIGTWFNRAVLSSQAFDRKLHAMGLSRGSVPSAEQALALRTWLANDLEKTFGVALAGSSRAAGAVYHLTDKLWVIPELVAFAKAHGEHSLAMVYDSHIVPAVKAKPAKDGKPARKAVPAKPSPNQDVVDRHGSLITFYPRDKTNIMHHKFLVTDGPTAVEVPTRVMMGSANFTTEGITQQANLLHVFDSPEMAAMYEARALALASNPTKGATSKLVDGWSKPISVGTARVRLALSPEPEGKTTQIDTIVAAIKKAKHSVMFCIFTPTDKHLRDACFEAADRGLMMFGLVNNLSKKSAAETQVALETGKQVNGTALANMELYHRSRDKKDVIEGMYFSAATVPEGFEPELLTFPGEDAPGYAPVVIHHKFIVIDGEGENPIVYTGSANMSKNSENNNDENLLEIQDRHLSGIYVAEFMRLYEHYRARAISNDEQRHPNRKRRLILTPNGKWAGKYYKPDSPEDRARRAMVYKLGT